MQGMRKGVECAMKRRNWVSLAFEHGAEAVQIINRTIPPHIVCQIRKKVFKLGRPKYSLYNDFTY